MAYSGETLDLTKTVDGGSKPPGESGGLLKAAANFAKGKIPDMASAPVAKAGAAATKRTSVMSINVEMAGTIVTPDELHIYGAFEGNVRASSITIGAGGSVKGEVVGETVTVLGTVDGRIHGQTVQLGAGGVVRGDIVHGTLGIDPAAAFEGASKRAQNPLKDAPAIAAKRQSSPSQ